MSSDVLLHVGDTTQAGLFGLSVTATRSATGPVFGLPEGRKPPKGKEWLVADVVVESHAKQAVEVESLVFKVSSRSASRARKPAEVLIATDLTHGLDSSGALRPGGKLAMSLAFPVAPRDIGVHMTFRVTGQRGGAGYVLR